MSDPLVEDVKVEIDYQAVDPRMKINLQNIQESLDNIQDYLNDVKERIYNLENP